MRAWISFLAAIPSLAAQEEPEHKPHPGVDSFRVNLAIDRGSRFLLEKNSFAEWGSPGEKLREHDLVLYTLFHAGVKPELKRFQELLEKILESELQTTYTVSLQAMLLQELDPDKYRWRLAQICQFLVDNQSQNGQWPYGEPTKIPKDTPTFSPPQKDDIATSGNKRKKKPRKQKPIRIRAQRTGVEKGDNSNAQYALLGLRACMEANVWPPRESL